MKKILLILCVLGVHDIAFSQTNNFPSTGDATLVSGNRMVYDHMYYTHGYTAYDYSGLSEAALLNYGYYGHRFATRQGLALVIRGDNNYLGLGVTNPSARLHVNGKGRLDDNLKIFGTSEAWAEGISIIKPSGWVGIRLARNDPATGQFEGNWGLGYNASSGNDFSISNHYNNTQNDYIFHISASTQNIGIGTATPSEKLSVNGKIRAKEVKVEATNWPDYVFESSYALPNLKVTEKFIKENKHLPEIPSAKEVEKKGISLGEMDTKLLKKIEELTLYLIEQSKELKKLRSEIDQLKSKL